MVEKLVFFVRELVTVASKQNYGKKCSLDARRVGNGGHYLGIVQNYVEMNCRISVENKHTQNCGEILHALA